jgi:hypothetical protein
MSRREAKAIMRKKKAASTAEDEKRLQQLADLILRERSYGNSAADTDELYFLITGEAIAKTKPGKLRRSDTFDMFVNAPPSVKANMFFRKMDMQLNRNSDVHATMMQPSGVQTVVYRSLFNPRREEWLQHSCQNVCNSCWQEMFREVFQLTARTVLVELTSLSRKLVDLGSSASLPLAEIKSLDRVLGKSIEELHRLVDAAGKDGIDTKSGWVQLLERLYQLMADTMNNFMMKVMLNRISQV